MPELTDSKQKLLSNLPPVVNLNVDYDKEDNSLDENDDCEVSNNCLVAELEAEKELASLKK